MEVDPNEPIPGWSVEAHVMAYRRGAFPMAHEGEIDWYVADPRGVLPMTEAEGLHVPRTVAKEIRRGRFEVRYDTAFEDVVRGCAAPRAGDEGEPSGGGGGVWLDERIIQMMLRLFEAGVAHSAEAWARDDETGEAALVGGVYGLAIGRVFFAESMFHRAQPRGADGRRVALDGTNASSVALVTLARRLHAMGFRVLDVQVGNEHTARFGVREVDAEVFASMLAMYGGGGSAWGKRAE